MPPQRSVYKNKYRTFGLTLTDKQKKKITQAVASKSGTTMRLPRDHLHGEDELPLTNQQIAHIMKNKNQDSGVNLKLSATQLRKGILTLPSNQYHQPSLKKAYVP